MSDDKNPKIQPVEEVVEELVEEGEGYPVDAKTETVHFPWSILIICGVLILLIIACFVIIMVLEGQ